MQISEHIGQYVEDCGRLPSLDKDVLPVIQ